MIGDKSKTTKKKGFAMLYAVIIASVVVIVAYAVSQLALTETNLSIIGRRSQVAFYAANSGLECASYGDVRLAVFPIPYPPSDPFLGSGENLNCAGNSFSVFTPNISGDTYDTKFTIDFDNGSRAEITVTKTYDSGTNLIHTSIRSDGYDKSSGDRRVQRSIKSTY